MSYPQKMKVTSRKLPDEVREEAARFHTTYLDGIYSG
jgi:hypothetical protein